jgi:hypothetical protein
VLPALVAEEAAADGGTRRAATVLLRGAGWLVPHAWAAHEPVAVPPDAFAAAASGAAVDWLAHPSEPPPRPEAIAEAGGWSAQLEAQLALVGSTAHCLRPGAAPGTLDLAMPRDATVLWVMADDRLRRVDLFA